MKKKLLLISLFLLCALFATLWVVFAPTHVINSGLTTQRGILENNEQFVLYSLDPASIYTTGDAKEDLKAGMGKSYKEKFHLYGVIGKTQVVAPNIKARLIEALKNGIDEGRFTGEMCFDPRHGIRVVRGDQRVDLLICFECQQIKAWTNSSSGTAYTSGSPKKVFDSALKNAKVPLAKSPYAE